MKRFFMGWVIVGILSAGSVHAMGFTLTSPDISGQVAMTQVFSGFGCTGQNISPALRWVHAPRGTRSFAVTVYDPDAPTGSGWWHWVIFNIPATVHELKRGAGDLKRHLAPQGSVQSVTDFGKPGYGGPCPPKGDRPHRYIFTVFALDVPVLKLGPTSPPAMVGYFLNMHEIAKASLIAYFGR